MTQPLDRLGDGPNNLLEITDFNCHWWDHDLVREWRQRHPGAMVHIKLSRKSPYDMPHGIVLLADLVTVNGRIWKARNGVTDPTLDAELLAAHQ